MTIDHSINFVEDNSRRFCSLVDIVGVEILTCGRVVAFGDSCCFALLLAVHTVSSHWACN